ncbi:hypothetical protein HAX54_030144 [Datura stramonium]|uniref:Uncharacterized protein n=1 Tax=Datura stramonium TaxID=4076 RepID=A0ABS8V782_DATST|nr:hypothetical protein [Datura stramonium]
MMKNGSADSFPMSFPVANALLPDSFPMSCDWTEREGFFLLVVLSLRDLWKTLLLLWQYIDIFIKAVALGEQTSIVVDYNLQGPRESALEFFEFMGFKCPSRKNVADFLQEYDYVSVTKFAEGFQSFHVGSALAQELAIPFDKRDNHPTTLSSSNYGMKKSELLKISFDWQMLLLKRNSVVLVFKVTQVMICESFFATENLNTCSSIRSILRVLLLVVEIDILFSIFQLFLIILITISVFFRSTMRHNTLEDGVVYLGALYFAILMVIFNGFLEVPMVIAKLPVL